jgi:hypothetical protein
MPPSMRLWRWGVLPSGVGLADVEAFGGKHDGAAFGDPALDLDGFGWVRLVGGGGPGSSEAVTVGGRDGAGQGVSHLPVG